MSGLDGLGWPNPADEPPTSETPKTNSMHPAATAPRDLSPFLGHFGYPWLLMTMWNPVSENWAVATVQCGLYEGEWHDTYFETDHETAASLLGWLPLPSFSALPPIQEHTPPTAPKH